MAKPKKSPRPKPRTPRGFPDRTPADIRATNAMIERIREVYERYGFDPIETPMFEYSDALGKFLPDQDRPNAGVFSQQDDDEQWMSLRYDLTAPLARHVAQNINEITLPYRTYRQGWVFRNEKPGPGRFRQFMQFDADSVGAPGPAADAEMCMMMADTMEALGIEQGSYLVRVNSRLVLDGVLDAIGLGGVEEHQTRLLVLRSLDKLDRVGLRGVRHLLGEGRFDESGDFTKGAGLDHGQVAALSLLLSLQSAQPRLQQDIVAHVNAGDFRIDLDGQETDPAVFSRFLDKYDFLAKDRPIADLTDEYIDALLESPFAVNRKFREGMENLRTVFEVVREARYDGYQIRPDITCVRGLEYYTGAVYECELTFPVTNEKGETVTFGSVAGGGRYDGLVKRFTGQDVPATGFSIGVSRLQTALKNLGKLPDDAVRGPVLVTVMDRDAEALAFYQSIVSDLRREGIRAEMYQGNPKQFGKQLQYADRRNSPVAIIAGSDERERGVVQVKDLDAGARLADEITSNEAWRATRPAQQEVARDELLAAVQKIIASDDADDLGKPARTTGDDYPGSPDQRGEYE